MTLLPRSWLFTPGSRPDRFVKALASEADAIILDLEDAVAEESKTEARQHVLQFLEHRSGEHQKICVRINPLRRKHGLEDLVAISRLTNGPHYLLVPKAEEAAELALVDHVLTDQASAIRLLALVESAQGICHAPRLAVATPRLEAFMFGAADYAADLGQQVGNFKPDFARQSLVNAAASGGIAVIDSPFFAIDKPLELLDECRRSRGFGFAGKAAIHPSQIEAIRTAFSPTLEERDLATRILGAAPDGVGVLDGKMIDVAMVRWASGVI